MSSCITKYRYWYVSQNEVWLCVVIASLLDEKLVCGVVCCVLSSQLMIQSSWSRKKKAEITLPVLLYIPS